MSFKAASRNIPIELDPQHDGELVRKAFLIEGCLNLGTIPLVTHPLTVLPYLINHSRDLNATTVLFARLFGVVVIAALTPGLFVGARNTRNAIESRRIVYVMLGGAEVFLVPMLLHQAWFGKAHGAVFGYTTALVGAAAISLPLLWRIYVLLVNPDMLGRYREVKGESNEGSRLTD